MLLEGGLICPLLDEDEALGIVAVAMHRVGVAAGFFPRALDVLAANSDRFFDRSVSNEDATVNDDHHQLLQ